MELTTQADRQAQIVALARPAVARLAPEELPLLEATVAASQRRTHGRRVSRSEEMLGFGWDESTSVLTFAAIGAAQAVLVFVGEQAGEVLREEVSTAARKRVRRWFTRRAHKKAGQPGDPVAIVLNDEELRRVRRVARATARDFGLDRGDADILADAIVGRLGLPLNNDPPSEEA
ncbi:hypothetical protein O7631_23540 [Micromonospora sp. WMMD967]|uniref:hypothetical protein n=1 Tax=Micromonospora sp. WMMD967 TaxID=3016101 RepID=UPI002415CEFA|nr:hypothetical protein [Micromonospora sp. WMMD967]MDG4839507.1 hypothetical protein [Micromonospora sp. WMMD967]